MIEGSSLATSPTKPRVWASGAGRAVRSLPSDPERPTAVAPAELMRVTRCLLILPARTMETTSMVGGVGDAEAVEELGLDVEAAEPEVDLGAAAVDEDGAEADAGEEDEVGDDGGLEGGGFHGGAAVLDHDRLAAEFLDEGEGLGEDVHAELPGSHRRSIDGGGGSEGTRARFGVWEREEVRVFLGVWVWVWGRKWRAGLGLGFW